MGITFSWLLRSQVRVRILPSGLADMGTGNITNRLTLTEMLGLGGLNQHGPRADDTAAHSP